MNEMYIVSFNSTHHAIRTEKLLSENNMKVTTLPTPREISSSCGISVRFLKDGNKVKFSIRFRGRELGHPDKGYDIMNNFAEYCSEFGNVEKPAKMESRNMIMFMAPKTGK